MNQHPSPKKGELYKLVGILGQTKISLYAASTSSPVIGKIDSGMIVIFLESKTLPDQHGWGCHRVIVNDQVGWGCGWLRPLYE